MSQFSQTGCDPRQVAGLVTLTRLPHRCDVGGIGFENECFIAKACRKPANLQRTRPGHGPTETQTKALGDIGLGLLLAAIEGVRDPFVNTCLPHMLENEILCPANMQQDRQIKFTGDPQLGKQESHLTLPIQARYEMVETDLANRHKARIVQRRSHNFPQGHQVFIPGGIHAHRMNPQGVAQPRLTG